MKTISKTLSVSKSLILLSAIILSLIILTSSQANAQPLERMWNTSIGPLSHANTLEDVAVDHQGFIYTTGPIVNGNNDIYFTMKLNPFTGDTLWSRVYSFGDQYSRSTKIAVDSAGNIYVAGGCGTSPIAFEIGIIKYSPNGEILWTLKSGVDFMVRSEYIKMSISKSGYLYVAGGTFRDEVTMPGAVLLKYNLAGQLQWGIRAIEAVTVQDMCFDSQENIIITGSESYGQGQSTKKYSSNGTHIWTINHEICPPNVSPPIMFAVTTDQNDNVYVGGHSCVGGVRQKTLRKYSPTGQVLWTKYIDLGANINLDYFTNIVFDHEGYFYAGGLPLQGIKGNIGGDPLRKYNTNGDLLWLGEGPGTVLGFRNSDSVVTYWKTSGVSQNIPPYRQITVYNNLTGVMVDSAAFLTSQSFIHLQLNNSAVMHNIGGNIEQVVTVGSLNRIGGKENFMRVTAYYPSEIPMTPSGFFLAPISDSIRLNFADNSIIETGFKVQRSSNSGASWQDAVTLPQADPYYPFRVVKSIHNTSGGTGNLFRINAFNENGKSDWIGNNNITYPTAPAQLKANYGPGNIVTLQWKDHSRIETGYKIERKTNNDTSYHQIGTTGANATSFVDDQLPSPSSGNIYEYRARAFKDNINSEYSNIASVVFEAPLAPDSLKVSPPEVGTAVLSWIPGSGNEEGYIIERSTGSNANFIFRDSIPSDDTVYTDSGLSPGTTYWYRMYAYNPLGNSPYSDTVFILITGNITGNNEIPQSFALYQNYPNPFNPVTNIKFDLPKQSHVRLMIYDILGREVATLVNETRQAGRYELNWNASAFASGVYFYKIYANDFTDIKRLVLLK